MRVRNAAALALAETLVALPLGHLGGADGFCWQIDRLEVAYVKWQISGQGLLLSVHPPRLLQQVALFICAQTSFSSRRAPRVSGRVIERRRNGDRAPAESVIECGGIRTWS